MFTDAVLYQHADATVTEIHKAIADHLKQAPHRSGGAGKGCHLKANAEESEEDLFEGNDSNDIEDRESDSAE